MREHQRPGCERHEFPANQKCEGVICEENEIHAREIGREIRKDAQRRGFVPAIAEPVKARHGTAEIDHEQEERRQRVQAEMGTEERQPKGQG